MILYSVQIIETLSAKVRLEANDREEALAIAMEGYCAGEAILDKENLAGIKFGVEENDYD